MNHRDPESQQARQRSQQQAAAVAEVRQLLIAAGRQSADGSAVTPASVTFTDTASNGDRVDYELHVCSFDRTPTLGVLERGRRFAQGGSVFNLGTSRHGTRGIFGIQRGVRGTPVHSHAGLRMDRESLQCQVLEGSRRVLRERAARPEAMDAVMRNLPAIRRECQRRLEQRQAQGPQLSGGAEFG